MSVLSEDKIYGEKKKATTLHDKPQEPKFDLNNRTAWYV